MEQPKKKNTITIDNRSTLICLCNPCANNINSACNLKWVGVDPTGKCSGLVKLKTARKPKK